MVACAALLLCVPALWNGLPFFYPDTPTYLRGAEMATGQVAKRLWSTQADRHGVELAATQDAAAPSPVPPAARGLTSVQDKIVLAGRSIYYGGLLHAAQGAGSMWLAVVAQALCVAAVLHLVMVTLWRVRPAPGATHWQAVWLRGSTSVGFTGWRRAWSRCCWPRS